MFNAEQMQKFLWAQFTKEVNELPPEVKAALRNLEVRIIRRRRELRLEAYEIVPGNPHSEKAAEALFKQLVKPVSEIAGAFQCRIEIFE